jgi:hypothetical protein
MKHENMKRILKYESHLKISMGTLTIHHVCMIRDSKYVTKDVKCYNSCSLLAIERCFISMITPYQTSFNITKNWRFMKLPVIFRIPQLWVFFF